MNLNRYDDIIHLPHPVSPSRPHMPQIDRAAQFAPFSALSGFAAAIEEAARQTEAERELSEDAKDSLDAGGGHAGWTDQTHGRDRGAGKPLTRGR